jgi:hypothetical protein
MSNSTKRSPQAKDWRKLYNTARWQRTRDQQHSRQPLCEACRRQGFVTPATVCHHIHPEHKLDPLLFFHGPFMSLCAECHDGEFQQQERIGFSTAIGMDGWPTHDNHPANKPGGV